LLSSAPETKPSLSSAGKGCGDSEKGKGFKSIEKEQSQSLEQQGKDECAHFIARSVETIPRIERDQSKQSICPS
jgi:hypothetical protein